MFIYTGKLVLLCKSWVFNEVDPWGKTISSWAWRIILRFQRTHMNAKQMLEVEQLSGKELHNVMQV